MTNKEDAMNFVISYSGGKDSVMALHKMLEQGHTPIGLLVTINQEAQRSWFHGVDFQLLQSISDSLKIPLLLCETTGEDYPKALEQGMRKAKELGAEACVFGDIDIEEHRTWCKARCEKAGLLCVHPLWQRNRQEHTRETIQLGYRCIIKCIRNDVLSRDFLGKELNTPLLQRMERLGIDICGENGEYHTVVVNGPAFYQPVAYKCGEIFDFGTISAVDIRAVRP